MAHDFNRPYIEVSAMELFAATQEEDAQRYGKLVRAFGLTNREYQHRLSRLGQKNKMKPAPGSRIHIMPGYLVVRNLGTARQYETWMPEDVFGELYTPVL